MAVSLRAVLRKNHEGPGSLLSGVDYPMVVAVVERMRAQDPRIIFDSLRPMGDEFWNLIDGRRTVGEIAEAVCLEFGFEVEPGLFVPLVEGLVASNAAGVLDD